MRDLVLQSIIEAAIDKATSLGWVPSTIGMHDGIAVTTAIYGPFLRDATSLGPSTKCME
jgi:hypothetical protein